MGDMTEILTDVCSASMVNALHRTGPAKAVDARQLDLRCQKAGRRSGSRWTQTDQPALAAFRLAARPNCWSLL